MCEKIMSEKMIEKFRDYLFQEEKSGATVNK